MRHGKTRPERTPRSGLLGRLGIRGKLNLLLMLPLTAVVLVSVPYVAGEVDDARSARTTADVASQARALGTLAWELQRERLLTAHYIASSSASSSAMLKQQGVVADTVNQVRAQLPSDAPEELAAALVRIGSLNEIRENALRRAASLDSVARTYHAVIDSVINSLRLVPQQTSDAEGTRQLTALDALLRANEENSLRGMALIIVLVTPDSGEPVLADAKQQSSLFLERFVQQADVTQATQVVAVEQGETGRRVDSLEGKIAEARGPQAVQNLLPDILGAVDAQSNQRRLAQDAVTTGITDAATARADAAQNLAWTIGIGAGVLFLLVGGLAIAVSRSIADPLRKLTKAATSVADLASTELVRVTDTEQAEELAPRLATIDVSSQDELGKLAEAFNRVQSTAAELVERQAVTRRNVGLMFANVAKRTQNLVGRQLALVDELERNEQDVALLASLYRLDHLSTRLRRNADNLLVVSGNRDEARISGPIELSTALRSALAEIEDYQRVRLGSMGDLLLSSPFGSDLVLIFAELLENATSFSPPESFVDVGTKILPDGSCLIVIVDQGIGMTGEKLAEENRRLVERERLELAPTSVLGLFVVGRLARRHGLKVELTETEPGAGITARITVPSDLLTYRAPVPKSVPAPPAWPTAEPGDEPEPQPRSPRPQPQPQPGKPAEAAGHEPPTLAIAGMIPRDGLPPRDFRWFRKTDGEIPEPMPMPEPTPPVPSLTPVPAYEAPKPTLTADSGETRGGLRRRVKGAQLPGAPDAPSRQKSRHDPEAAKAAFDGFEAGLAKATTSSPREAVPPQAPPPPVSPPAGNPMPMPMPTPTPVPAASRGGLTRRVPGAQLAPGLAKGPAARHQTARAALNTTKPKGMRDPEAERAAFDAFSDGLEKAVNPEMEQREKSKR
ncbi:sensor histidine kinase [Amycolatopsis azurea]|uniref:histidine kinase n=1 Tax=Amycolatopsis azurea DSM 43854 TaxID=1238180 RepID=M2QMK9_9PSEU|nr:nitrate- and nitrite sensing domain-containing protein [Amycolatopsis azurea]EMD27062.1 Putative sensor-like histidine kinase [Amycolatopsis azurea DSM 43854]OOC08725.1 histidine kinase [Amycolatopsis azurea DSM 43854]